MEILSVGTDLLIGQMEEQTEEQRNMTKFTATYRNFPCEWCCAVYFLVCLLSQPDWNIVWEMVTPCNIYYGSPFFELVFFVKGKAENTFHNECRI